MEARDPYFRQKVDCCGQVGASSYQKVTAALRVLAYAASADQLDEYIRLGESTILETLERFCITVIDEYGPTYLRRPTKEDLELILRLSQKEGFIGCLGSCEYLADCCFLILFYYSEPFVFCVCIDHSGCHEVGMEELPHVLEG